MEKTEIHQLPVMKACCATWPFKLVNGKHLNPQLAGEVTQSTLFKAQQICHGTESDNRKPNNRCKGSYDHNFEIYQRLGLDPDKCLK